LNGSCAAEREDVLKEFYITENQEEERIDRYLAEMEKLSGAAGELAGSLQEVSMSPEQLAALQKQAEEVAECAVQTAESVQKSVEDVTALFGDGESLLAGLIYMGASAGSYAVKSAAGTMAAGALTKKYIGSVGEDADAYLR